jgi:hypothetical protein
VNPDALESDCAALVAAGSLAEEALALHREALAIVEQGWHSQSGSAATDALRRQCGEAAELVTALHDATGDFRALRDTAEYGVDASTAEPYNRLSDRPPAQFDTAEPFIFGGAPAPAPAPALPPPPVPAPAPAWTPGTAGPPLPDLGGALVGLVAQIADAVSSISAEEAAGLETTLPTDPPNEPRTEPRTEQPAESPAAPPEQESPTLPPVSPPVQFVGPTAPPDSAAPSIAAPPPLLAAERPPDPPPEPRPASPPAPEVPTAPVAPALEQPPGQSPEDPKTPCEIAADALPQVGQ